MTDWHDLVTRHGPAVWRTAYRLLGNRADADECFQEAFLAALEASRRGPAADWRALLLHLAAARAVDRLRRRYRRPAGPFADAPSAEPSPPDAAQAAELAERLRAALAELPAAQAEAFCLCALDGFSYREAAARLGVSADAVGVLVHRARQRLRTLLAGDREESRRDR